MSRCSIDRLVICLTIIAASINVINARMHLRILRILSHEKSILPCFELRFSFMLGLRACTWIFMDYNIKEKYARLILSIRLGGQRNVVVRWEVNRKHFVPQTRLSVLSDRCHLPSVWSVLIRNLRRQSTLFTQWNRTSAYLQRNYVSAVHLINSKSHSITLRTACARILRYSL